MGRCLNCVIFIFCLAPFQWGFISKIQNEKVNCRRLWLLFIFICLFYNAGVEPGALRALDQCPTAGLQALPWNFRLFEHTLVLYICNIYKLIASQRRKTCFSMSSFVYCFTLIKVCIGALHDGTVNTCTHVCKGQRTASECGPLPSV